MTDITSPDLFLSKTGFRKVKATTNADMIGVITSVGNVTSVGTLTTANVPDSTDARYVTDAEEAVLDNTSGTNTGDSASIPIGYLTTDGTLAANSDVLVPSEKAVKTYVASVIGALSPDALLEIVSNTIGGATVVTNIVTLTRVQYNGLTPDAATLYFIDG